MIDETLVRASRDVRHVVATMPNSPVTTPVRRLRRRQRVASVAGILIGVALIGGTSMLLTGGQTRPVASEAVEAPTEPAEAREGLPILGLGDGWQIAGADEQDDCAVLPFRQVDYYDSTDTPRLVVAIRIDGVPAGSPCEAQVWWMARNEYSEVTVRGHSARLIADGDGFVVGWRESDAAVVGVVIQPEGLGVVTRDQALSVAESVTDIDPAVWDRALADLGGTGSTTTTTAPVHP